MKVDTSLDKSCAYTAAIVVALRLTEHCTENISQQEQPVSFFPTPILLSSTKAFVVYVSTALLLAYLQIAAAGPVNHQRERQLSASRGSTSQYGDPMAAHIDSHRTSEASLAQRDNQAMIAHEPTRKSGRL